MWEEELEIENKTILLKSFAIKLSRKMSQEQVRYISFYIVLARTSSTVINKTSHSGLPCCFWMLKRNLLKFYYYDVFYVFWKVFFIKQRKLHSIPNLRKDFICLIFRIIINEGWFFGECPCCIYEGYYMISHL